MPCLRIVTIPVLVALAHASIGWSQTYTFTHLAGPYVGPGVEDGGPGVARFVSPLGLAIDSGGTIYVADLGSSTIRRVTADGDVTTLAGLPFAQGYLDGVGAAARFSQPSGIAVTAGGTLFVTDTGNSTIRVITPDGTVTTLTPVVPGFEPGSGNEESRAARLWSPRGIAVADDGAIYVADTGNHVIRRVTADGVMTTVAGRPGERGYADATGDAARFAEPFGIAVDRHGVVYIADTQNHVIRRMTSTGSVTTLAGVAGVLGSADGSGAEARFTNPGAVAVDSAGNLLVTDGNSLVRRVTTTGVVTTLAGRPGQVGWLDGPVGSALFNLPWGVAVGADEAVYVADAGNSVIRRVAGGLASTLAGVPRREPGFPAPWADGQRTAARFSGPRSITIDRAGVVWVADSGNHVIRRVTVSGDVSTPVGSLFTPGWVDGPGAVARFREPQGIAAGPDGLLYVADAGNAVIRTVAPSGEVSTLAGMAGVAGSADGLRSAARFVRPTSIAVGADGLIYVADAWDHVIRRITPEGQVTTLAGRSGQAGWVDGQGSEARFNDPRGVALDRDGNVYVSDYWNQAIRRVTPGGTVTTVAGEPGPQYAVDGPASLARFVGPSGIAVTAAGEILVSDMLYLRNAIRRISPSGHVSTIAGGAGRGDTDGPGLVASFGEAYGIVLDPNGTLFVADTGNNAIRQGVPTRYLAEGASSPAFDTRLALFNPGATEARATISFQRARQAPVTLTRTIPPARRVSIAPRAIPGLESAEFSTTIDAGEPLVVDRTVSWAGANAYGAHAETAVRAPSLTWYLAEGATHSGMQLFYLLQNPNAAASQVRVRFLRPRGAPLEKTYTLEPQSRTNVWVNVEEFPGVGTALSNTDVSAVFEVQNDQPIIVERALYLDVPGQFFGAGHESMGVTAPATEWFLAEGATGRFFDLFVLVANPGNTDALVEATFLLPGGSTVVKPYTIAANSRFNIWVDHEDPRLADTAVSTTIRSLNQVRVIVERALWWPEGGWYEAHNTPGATTTGTLWAVAEGELDGSRGLETYLLVANTSAFAANVKVTLFFEDGATATQTYTDIAPHSRYNVSLAAQFAQAAGKRFSATIESLGTTPAQIVVERAMYWNAAGQVWAAGTNALATKVR